MNEERTGLGEGILRGLKKIIFTDSPDSSPGDPPKVSDKPPTPETGLESASPSGKPNQVRVSDDKKLRVYQLLEKINRPGCDFFEVWNAAVEMGGVNALHIRSAYTSLRFADTSLSKAKLVETGNTYMNELKKILQEETDKRMAEKKKLETEMEMNSRKLDEEILQLEQQISNMQQKLSGKKAERETIHTRFTPEVMDIENKITEGRQVVDVVLSEMQEVMTIIQKEIN